MAQTGRKPDPKAIRLLKNDKAHAHRHKDKNEPEPSSNLPVAPDYLSERAAEIFTDFVKRVGEMYPPSETDMDIIVLYANNKEQLESYELYLRVEGSTYVSEGKYGDLVKARPEVAMLKECKAMQLRILTEFGLSPSSRCRINLPKKKEKKPNMFGAKPKKATG